MSKIDQYFAVQLLKDFIDANLKDFLPRRDAEIELCLHSKSGVDLEKGFVPQYRFDIWLINDNIRIGEIHLRVGLTDNLLKHGGHIGYEIDNDYRGHHYASKALSLLKTFAVENGMRRLLLTCDPKNIASRKTIERSGGVLIEIVKNAEVPHENTTRDTCYYLLEAGITLQAHSP
jgi:predicted acetyltransferase